MVALFSYGKALSIRVIQYYTEVYDNDEIYVHAMELEKKGKKLILTS